MVNNNNHYIYFYIGKLMVIVYRKSRHVRWNWEPSPDNPDLARYHFVIVDDRFREGILSRILIQLQEAGPIEHIQTIEGKVEGTRLIYLFSTYDSKASPLVIDWSKIGKPFKQDGDLVERKRGNIEDYVSRVYE